MSKIADADAVSEIRNSSMLQQYWQQVEQTLASPLWKGGHVNHFSFGAANNGCEADDDDDERPDAAAKSTITDTQRRLVSNFWNVLSDSCCLYLPQQDEQQQQQQQQHPFALCTALAALYAVKSIFALAHQTHLFFPSSKREFGG